MATSSVTEVSNAVPRTIRSVSNIKAMTSAEPRWDFMADIYARIQPKLDYRTSVRYKVWHAYGKTTGHTGFHSEISGRAPIPAIGSRNRQAVRNLSGNGAGPYIRTSAE